MKYILFIYINMTPDNVIDKKLYERIKKKLKKRLDEGGKRWNAYTSGQLVQEYKRLGGKYKNTNDERGLKRWFDEKWINVCEYNKGKIVPCGRKSADNLKNFPYCRPLVRINKNSPKSVKELSPKQREKLCKEKKKSPKKTVFIKKSSPKKLSRKISPKKSSPKKLSRKISPKKLSRKISPKKSSPKKSSPKHRKGTPHPNRNNIKKIIVKKSILRSPRKLNKKKVNKKKVTFAHKVIIKSKDRVYKVPRKKWNHKYVYE